MNLDHNIETGSFQIAQKFEVCRHCSERAPVYSLLINKDKTRIRTEAGINSDGEQDWRWGKAKFDFFVNFIEKISCTRDLSEYIYSISNGIFRLTKLGGVNSSESGAYYYLNHCASCGKSIGDVSLYDNPGQGFSFKTHAKMQSSVVFHPLEDSPTIHIMAYYQCRIPDSGCAKFHTENLGLLPPVNKNINPHSVSIFDRLRAVF